MKAPGELQAVGIKTTDQLAPVHILPPDRLNHLVPEFDSYVAERKTYKGKKLTPGYVSFEMMRMDDGTPYEVVIGQPKNQKSDVVVALTTPWLTSVLGHNMHTMLKVMETGYPTVMVGPEGGYRDRDPKISWRDKWRQAGRITLARSAHNMHEILDEIDETNYGFDHQAKKAIIIGESRGAMVAMGVEAMADRHERAIPYADVTAACFARPFSILEAMKYVKQGGKEGVALWRQLGELSAGALLNYPSTVNLSRNYLRTIPKTFTALISGQAGDLAKAIPLDRKMHIEAFNGDKGGQGQTWQEIFAHHPGVQVEHLDGVHLSLMGSLRRMLGRLALQLES